MWETRSPNHTLLVLFLYQRLDINKNIKKKKSHRRLHTEKKGKQQGELHQSNRLSESFQSEVIGFLLSQWGLIFLDSGMLQLWSKHHFVRLANPLLKTLTHLTRDHALIKVCRPTLYSLRLKYSRKGHLEAEKNYKGHHRVRICFSECSSGGGSSQLGGVLSSGKGIWISTIRSGITLVLPGGVCLGILQHPGLVRELCHLEFII